MHEIWNLLAKVGRHAMPCHAKIISIGNEYGVAAIGYQLPRLMDFADVKARLL